MEIKPNAAVCGTITEKPLISYTSTGRTYTRFAITVPTYRDYEKKILENREVIMIAFDDTAEFCCKYYEKGDMINCAGRYQHRRHYDEDTGEESREQVFRIDTIAFGNKSGGDRT